MKYRIIESLAKNKTGIWYAVERQERFLWWKYWVNWKRVVYPTKDKAESFIYAYMRDEKQKLSVIQEFETT